MSAANRTTDWHGLSAPSLEVFEAIARETFDRLPEAFRLLATGITIRVADFADDEDLAELEMESPFELLGLFQGVGLAHASATPFTGQLPNAVWLYRRAILDYWAEHEETLGSVISHVLIHEIGHHFGLSDEDMEAIEAAAG
ncbi:MAG: metallopeptidase family protein [Bauldia sp.]|nr:metallopeptidase family protein [Bauldia sp.]